MLREKLIERTLCRVSFSLILVFVVVFGAYCEKRLTIKPWYKYAKQLIEADELLIQHSIEGKETFLEDYDLKYKAEKQLHSSAPPTEYELEELLNSSKEVDKKVALVNIIIRQLYSPKLFKAILEHYNPKDDFLTKVYIYRCFTLLDNEQIKQFETELLRIISSEDNEAIITDTIPILIKMEGSKVIPLFVKYFRNGSKGLRVSLYSYLKKTDEQYLRKVREILEKENAVEALNFIKDADQGKKP